MKKSIMMALCMGMLVFAASCGNKKAETKAEPAKVEVEGYKEGINVADAAVYISPNMTRDLLRMRGVWSPEIKKAFDNIRILKQVDRGISQLQNTIVITKTSLSEVRLGEGSVNVSID